MLATIFAAARRIHSTLLLRVLRKVVARSVYLPILVASAAASAQPSRLEFQLRCPSSIAFGCSEGGLIGCPMGPCDHQPVIGGGSTSTAANAPGVTAEVNTWLSSTAYRSFSLAAGHGLPGACTSPFGRASEATRLHLTAPSVVELSAVIEQPLPPHPRQNVCCKFWDGNVNLLHQLDDDASLTMVLQAGNYWVGTSAGIGQVGLSDWFLSCDATLRIVEPCLQILQQPASSDVCNDNLAVLAIRASGASLVGAINYQWQWRPSSSATWSDVQSGTNSRGGVAFTTPGPASSSLILDFSPGHGTLPPGARPEFRCYVSNTCTNETSEVAVVTGCGACPLTPGEKTAKWRIADFDAEGNMTGQTPVAPGSGWEQHYDCNCPTAMLFHGLTSGPDATWIPCLAEEARRRYTGCVNILIADASEYMYPSETAWAAGVSSTVAAIAFDIPPLAAALFPGAVGAGAMTLFKAQDNIPLAARDLAEDYRCFLGPCGDSPGVDLMIGHSFGGGIAADLAARMYANNGHITPMLITIDTPYNVFNYVTMDQQAARAGQYFGRHLNYYSECRFPDFDFGSGWTGSGFGFGSPVAGANTRNFNASAGDRVTGRCTEMQHTCLANEICGLLASGGAWSLLDGSLPPGEYMEGSSPGSVMPGNQSPNCMPLSIPPWDNPTVVGDNLGSALNARQGVTESGGGLELRPPSSSSSSYAGGTVTLTGCAGFLLFEYQVEGLALDQSAEILWNGSVRWSASVNTPAGQWLTGIVDVRDGCATVGSLVLRLDPPAGGQPNPAAVFRVRNIRIIHRDIRECTAPPVIAVQPTNDTVRRSGAMALGVGAEWPYGLTYRWEKDGVPVLDGAQASGATVVGIAGPILVISQITTIEAGDYRCVVTNACGNVNSNTATVTVCIADTNSDGVTNSQDFFDFIAAFFALQPAADVNADGIVNSQDFFDFLAAFFAGCYTNHP